MVNLFSFLMETWSWLKNNLSALAILALVLLLFNQYHQSSQTNQQLFQANVDLGKQEADIATAQFNEQVASQEAHNLREEIHTIQQRNQSLQAALNQLNQQQQSQIQQFNEVLNDNSHQDWRTVPVPNDIARLLNN